MQRIIPPERPSFSAAYRRSIRLSPRPEPQRSTGVTLIGMREPQKRIRLVAVTRGGIKRPVPKRCPICATTEDEVDNALFNRSAQGCYICSVCGTVIDEAGNFIKTPL